MQQAICTIHAWVEAVTQRRQASWHAHGDKLAVIVDDDNDNEVIKGA